MANRITLPENFGEGGVGLDRMSSPNIYDILAQLVREHNALVDEFEAHTHKSEGGTRNTSTPQKDSASAGNSPGSAVTASERKLEIEGESS